MAKIKITLEGNETPEQVEEELAKAFLRKAEGVHTKPFADPILRQIELKWNADYIHEVVEKAIRDILEELKGY